MMKEIQVFDAHCDTAILWYKNRIDFFNGKKGHATYKKLKKGNVKFQVFAICLNSAAGEFDPLRDILQNIKFFTQRIDASRKVKLIRTKQDLIDVNKEKNLMGAILGIEGGDLIRGSFEIAEILYSLGVRVFTPVWNYRNSIGSGMWEEDSDKGLTRFGKKLIPFLQELGMIIDVSHAAKETFNDILECSIKPVIASHSNAKKICSHPRNLTDKQLKMLNKNGSVIGVNFFPKFL
ncbi:membrane dipeptidase, partial [Candidatus Dependentiae bacterium]|nr:membrane dipeptidase [Candidatus Dependentiae bacterium]